ncbi:MAG: hypothetical protein KF735_17200 [Chelatococcus sp.]|uniref:hypothetical protein n=1 Tax=Chelatococcus sp. TaxID=1953771 RepID=UPI0025BA8A21|nr:hypothetical protein [Chelatococcus sp.]MBX3539385.1 hypothetical protein [Chelatococcus sp.]
MKATESNGLQEILKDPTPFREANLVGNARIGTSGRDVIAVTNPATETMIRLPSLRRIEVAPLVSGTISKSNTSASAV